MLTAIIFVYKFSKLDKYVDTLGLSALSSFSLIFARPLTQTKISKIPHWGQAFPGGGIEHLLPPQPSLNVGLIA